jgi:hypothetical protein
MSTLARAALARTASGINVLLGIWLVVSPWVFHYSAMAPAMWSSVIVGGFIVVIAAIRLASWRDTAPFSWLNLFLALCTIASPWVYGYAANSGGVRDNVILGILIAALAIRSGGTSMAEERHPPGAPAH